jgi:hypothetical protein
MKKEIKSYMEANLAGANLYRANLSGADLAGANLYDADLAGANLYRADLVGANLRGADLRGADLYGANLYRADLFRADLGAANLSGANLVGANLRGADLAGADLDEASWPLWCGSLNAKTDRRLRVQLMFHVLSLMCHAEDLGEDEREVYEACLTYANGFHRSDVSRLSTMKEAGSK